VLFLKHTHTTHTHTDTEQTHTHLKNNRITTLFGKHLPQETSQCFRFLRRCMSRNCSFKRSLQYTTVFYKRTLPKYNDALPPRYQFRTTAFRAQQATSQCFCFLRRCMSRNCFFKRSLLLLYKASSAFFLAQTQAPHQAPPARPTTARHLARSETTSVTFALPVPSHSRTRTRTHTSVQRTKE
jgi:hypothetical protein